MTFVPARLKQLNELLTQMVEHPHLTKLDWDSVDVQLTLELRRLCANHPQ